ncbi:hypothetical protein DEDE109153_16415 [Deinococcus deserti]
MQAAYIDPPGGITAHPDVLEVVLRTMDEVLSEVMHQAEHDEALSPQQQGELIGGVQLGQTLAVALRGYAADPTAERLEMVNDLTVTLAQRHVLGNFMMARLPAINAASVLREMTPVPLLEVEFNQATRVVLDAHDQDVGETALLRLTWAGYRAPGLPKNPWAPSRAELTPRPTMDPTRFGWDQELKAIARSPHPAERHAALLLLHINGRDRAENLPLVQVLDQTSVLLYDLQRLARRERNAFPALDQLMTVHDGLAAELGHPDLSMTRRHKRSAAEPHTHDRTAQRLLRALRYERHRTATAAEQGQQARLWEALNQLEQELQAGMTPDQDEALKVRLLLLGLQGLTSTYRAPGMNLPVMVQLAAQVSGLDPLWAWQRTQPGDADAPVLRELLAALEDSLFLTALQRSPDWPAWAPRIRRSVTLAAGHLLATVRRRGLRLPDQTFLETWFATFGPLRATPLTHHELEAADRERTALILETHGALQTLLKPSDGLPESVVEALEPVRTSTPAAPEPAAVQPLPAALPHIQAARDLLRGRRMVLLGGVPSPHHHAALVEALALEDLDWIGSDQYAHGTHAQSHIRPGTALVVLAIRWMAHAHNTLRDVARERGVPYVMHPGGLSPSSVAWQILQQASRQLAPDRPAF